MNARAIRELGLSYELIRLGLELLTEPRIVRRKGTDVLEPPRVRIDGQHVALEETVQSEESVARSLKRLRQAELDPLEVPGDLWADAGFEPHPAQVAAIEALAQSPVLVLTGGPGVGKTTIVKKALALLQRQGTVTQVAPTGKAAIRMRDLTDFPASTIHRALGVRNDGWFHHAQNPLPTTAVLVDESSMISVDLMAALLRAIATGTRLLLVGDVDQLPSIQAGRVLYDIIASGAVPVVRLTQIFRQAADSRIPYVARDFNDGLLPSNLDGLGTDVRFVERADANACLDLLVRAVAVGIPQQKGIPSSDIQVLIPQKKGDVGVEVVNNMLQSVLNPPKATDAATSTIGISGTYQARAGDRVIQTRNNYDLEVMNGEQGRVLAVDSSGLDLTPWPTVRTSADAEDATAASASTEEVPSATPAAASATPAPRRGKYVLVVEYPDPNGERVLAYTSSEARELQLSYAISVHKSQGSAYPAVVMVVDKSHQYMLTRPLCYTALTRAESYVLVLGQTDTLARALRNTRGTVRRTRLQEFMR